MADPVGDGPDPRRCRLLQTSRQPSSLHDVAEAIAEYTEFPGHVYVERFDRAWRWSPADQGGSYPLLRVTARYLRVEHHGIIVPFRTVQGDWAVLMPDEGEAPVPDFATVITFDEPATAADVATRVERLVASG